jgi:hypothetical protein
MTAPAHRISWWVYPTGYGLTDEQRRERIRHSSRMVGWVAWDATCSCGWDSHTGGATRGSVRRDVEDHKLDVRTVEDPSTDPRVRDYILSTWH